MTNNLGILLKWICENDIIRVRQQARVILQGNKTAKDAKFCSRMLEKLDVLEGTLVELPSNLQGLLYMDKYDTYAEGKFLLRDTEQALVDEVLKAYGVSKKLQDMGIRYLPSLLLYGVSGCGKTELAKYIAYKAQLPYLYVNVANVIESTLGSTQKNLWKIFNFVKVNPCVLCFDEIDTFGLVRGNSMDVGEMNRIVVTLMQELDRLPNNVMVVATTNRFDALDNALIRRFTYCSEILPLSYADAVKLAEKYFKNINMVPMGIGALFAAKGLKENITAHQVMQLCTEHVIELLMQSNAK